MNDKDGWSVGNRTKARRVGSKADKLKLSLVPSVDDILYRRWKITIPPYLCLSPAAFK